MNQWFGLNVLKLLNTKVNRNTYFFQHLKNYYWFVLQAIPSHMNVGILKKI
uniref:Uncharacterized protein n=1 Tax=Lepeophtheirus salmonis TaxID=72036 RepID=A0A0K2TJE0_LEPSM